MPQRTRIGTSALIVLPALGLVLGDPPRAQARDNDPVCNHLLLVTYLLREVKEDVRNLKGIDDSAKEKTLGAVDGAIQQLKTCFKDMGGEITYIKPEPDNDPPPVHFRRAIREMKTATEELKAAKNVPADHRDAAIAAMDKASPLLQAALDASPRQAADDAEIVGFHLSFTVYALREVKDAVRSMKGLDNDAMLKLLGAMDDAISPLKACYRDIYGVDPQYVKPDLGEQPEDPDVIRDLRRALRALRDVKEPLGTARGVTAEHRKAALAAVDVAAKLLNDAIDAGK